MRNSHYKFSSFTQILKNEILYKIQLYFYYLERLRSFAHNFSLYIHVQILLLRLFSKSSPIKYVLINKVGVSRAL